MLRPSQNRYRGAMAQLAGTILYKEPAIHTGRQTSGRRVNKADRQWHRGTWLGKASISDEHLVGTARGVLTVRTIRRLLEHEQNDASVLNTFVGEPWNTRVGI